MVDRLQEKERDEDVGRAKAEKGAFWGDSEPGEMN
jgi:hypothetical protein